MPEQNRRPCYELDARVMITVLPYSYPTPTEVDFLLSFELRIRRAPYSDRWRSGTWLRKEPSANTVNRIAIINSASQVFREHVTLVKTHRRATTRRILRTALPYGAGAGAQR